MASSAKKKKEESCIENQNISYLWGWPVTHALLHVVGHDFGVFVTIDKRVRVVPEDRFDPSPLVLFNFGVLNIENLTAHAVQQVMDRPDLPFEGKVLFGAHLRHDLSN